MDWISCLDWISACESGSLLRRAADWIMPVAGLARVQCPHPMAIRSLATPATVGIYVTAVRQRFRSTLTWMRFACYTSGAAF